MKRVSKYILLASFLLSTVVFVQCNKDKCTEEFDELTGGMEQLAGTWEWFVSRGYCGTKYPNFCYYTPQSEGYTLSLMFRKDGKYRKYRNDSLIEYGGITYIFGQQDTIWNFSMYFIHDGQQDGTTGTIIQNDTLRLSTYPFSHDIQNYFVRK